MAKRRKKSTRRGVRRNPPVAARSHRRRHHRRRSVRRNPPMLSVKGITNDVVQGVKDAALITAGKMATNVVTGLVPVTGTVQTTGARIAIALAAGIGAQRVLGRDAARFVLAGGLTSTIESAVKALKVDKLTAALGSDEDLRRLYRTIGSYPQRRVGVGSYPQPAAIRAGVAMASARPGLGSGAVGMF